MMFNLCYTAARGRESERRERRKSERIKKEAKGKKK